MSIHLEVVLVLAQDRCVVCDECTSGIESVWAHPIVLPANGGQEEAHFDLFGDSINLVARLVHGLPRMYHVHGNRFGHTRMVLRGNVCRVEACFGPF